MARNWKQRFTVTGGSKSVPDGVSPDDELLKAERRALDDFRKGLITADDAMAEFAAAVRKYGRAAGQTVDERQSSADRVENRLDAISRGLGVKGVSKEVPIDLGKHRDDKQKLMDAVDDALQKFKDGLITADEAAKRQSNAYKKFGEGAGLTLEETKEKKKKDFDRLSSNADFLGKDRPTDPDANPLGDILGQLGLPKELTKQLGGLLGKIPGGSAVSGLLKGGLGGGGAAAGAAGGASGLLAVAGPLAAIPLAAEAVKGFYTGVSDVTRKLGDIGSSIAANDGAGAITGLMDGFGEAAGNVPVIGGLLEAQIGMYTQFQKTFEQVVEAFRKRGEELKGLSGTIASASAEAETGKLLADIREAQNLGNEYAAVIRQKAELEVEQQKALEPIKRGIMEGMIPLLKIITVEMKLISAGLDGAAQNRKALNALVKRLVDLTGVNGDFLKDIFKSVEEFFNGKKDDQNQLLKDFLAFTDADLSVRNEYMPAAAEPVPLGIDLLK